MTSTSGMREALEAAAIAEWESQTSMPYSTDGLMAVINLVESETEKRCAALSAVPAPLSDMGNHVANSAANQAEAVPQQLSWQPIESAPRDHTTVFVWGSAESSPFSRPHIGTERMHEAYWDGSAFCCEDLDAWVPEPTHWMPLPSPPSELSGTITSGETAEQSEVVVPQWRADPKTVEDEIARSLFAALGCTEVNLKSAKKADQSAQALARFLVADCSVFRSLNSQTPEEMARNARQ